MKRAVIPDTVDRIQYRAFYNCPQLETISISDRTQRVRDDHGELDIFAFSKLMDNNRCTSCGGRMKGFPFKKCTLCGKDTTPKFLK